MACLRSGLVGMICAQDITQQGYGGILLKVVKRLLDVVFLFHFTRLVRLVLFCKFFAQKLSCLIS